MRKAIAFLLVLPLAACSSVFSKEPAAGSPPPPGVSYRVEKNDVGAADRKAQDYCGKYSKKAKKDNTRQASDSTIVTYSCS